MLQSRPRASPSGFTVFTFSLFIASAYASTLVNVTVDDTFGNAQENLQIVYQPAGAWTLGQSCTDCEARLDTTQVENGTWHDTSYLADNPPSSPLTASLTFDGVAIYVYCVVTHASTDPFGNSDMTFYLDGVQVGRFVQPPNGDPTYHYNSPVYVNESIPSGSHTFMLENGRAGGQTALALLDYIVFSRVNDDTNSNITTSGVSSLTSSTSPPTSSPTAAIGASHTNNSKRTAVTAGIITAAVLAVILTVALLIYCTRRRRRARCPHGTTQASRTAEKSWTSDVGSTIDTVPSTPQDSHSSPLPLLARFSPISRTQRSHILDPYPLSLARGSASMRKGFPHPALANALSPGDTSRNRQLPQLPDDPSTDSILRTNSPLQAMPSTVQTTINLSPDTLSNEGPCIVATAATPRERRAAGSGSLYTDSVVVDPGGRHGIALRGDGGRSARDDHGMIPVRPVLAAAREPDVGEGSQMGEEGLPSYAAAVTAGCREAPQSKNSGC